MKVGDKAQVLGTVRDMVGGSTLLVTDDGREYWILDQHVSEQPQPETPAEEAATPAAHETKHAEAHTPEHHEAKEPEPHKAPAPAKK